MKLLLILVIYTFFVKYEEDIISYYERIIEQQLNESVEYQYPANAYSFRPHSRRIEDIGSYDFIIIGAGSAGTVIANRLTENINWTVLLLEAGTFGNNVTNIPEMTSSVRLSEKCEWGYKTIPQKTACLDSDNQQCRVPRGRGVGGSALINGLVYTRCNKLDYDQWAAMGNPGWSYEEVLPYFKKSEEIRRTDPDVPIDLPIRGTDGYIATDLPIPRHPLSNAWLGANQEQNFKILDYNGYEQVGAAITQINTRKGVRSEGGNSYIIPFLNRENLIVSTESFVTKILISNRTVTKGVEFVRRGAKHVARASKEVILSAGTISSPQILMLSGINPKEHLQKVGIKTVRNLHVGTKYKDHAMFFGLTFSSNLSDMQQPLSEYIKQYLKGEGSITNLTEALGTGVYRSFFIKEASPDFHFQTTDSLNNQTRPSDPEKKHQIDVIFESLQLALI